MLLSLLFLACQDSKTIGGDDTGEPADTDTDTDTDTDSDTDMDTDTDPWQEVDWTGYVGERTFKGETWGYSCEESSDDAGVELTEGSEYEQLTTLCPLCSHFYENEPAEESVCDGYLPLGTTYRALLVTDAGVAAYFYTEDEGTLEESGTDSATGFDGATLEFDYEISVYGIPVAVNGYMQFGG